MAPPARSINGKGGVGFIHTTTQRQVVCELFFLLSSLRFRFASRRADFGDHDHRPKTLRISVRIITMFTSPLKEVAARLGCRPVAGSQHSRSTSRRRAPQKRPESALENARALLNPIISYMKLLLVACAATSASGFLIAPGVTNMAPSQSLSTAGRASRVHCMFKQKDKAKAAIPDECEVEPEKNMLTQIKDAGIAGAISYAAWELAFWGLSVPVALFAYYEVTGHFPDFNNAEDLEKLGAEAFAFVNLARFAVPARLALALSTTPWIKENIVEKYIDPPKDC